MGEVIICITAKNAAGIAISEGKPDAATKAAAMLNSFLLTVNRYAMTSGRSVVINREAIPIK